MYTLEKENLTHDFVYDWDCSEGKSLSLCGYNYILVALGVVIEDQQYNI